MGKPKKCVHRIKEDNRKQRTEQHCYPCSKFVLSWLVLKTSLGGLLRSLATLFTAILTVWCAHGLTPATLRWEEMVNLGAVSDKSFKNLWMCSESFGSIGDTCQSGFQKESNHVLQRKQHTLSTASSRISGQGKPVSQKRLASVLVKFLFILSIHLMFEDSTMCTSSKLIFSTCRTSYTA